MMPSAKRNPAASSKSWPGVRMVTDKLLDPTRISRGYGKQVFLPLRYQAVDLADWNTDGAWRHKPFPNPSRRSNATAMA